MKLSIDDINDIVNKVTQGGVTTPRSKRNLRGCA